MGRLQLEIVTPDRIVLPATEVEYVSLPGVEGEFGVLPGHIPFFAALQIGCLYFQRDGKKYYACLNGGFAEVADNRVQVLADSAELAANIDRDRAEAALKRAQERLERAKNSSEHINTARAEAALKRALNRLQGLQLR